MIRRPRCPRCGSMSTRTYRSLPAENGHRIQYRRCLRCLGTFKVVIEAETKPPAPRKRQPQTPPRRPDP